MAVTPIHALVPLRTTNGQNAREHHMVRHRRVRAERAAIAWALATRTPPAGPVRVLMTRVSPPGATGVWQPLDAHDNLRGALKAPVDAVAQWLGRDDADPSIEWRYAQRQGRAGQWAVEVQVESGGEG